MGVMSEEGVPLWRQVQRKNFIKWSTLADYLELDPVQRSFLLPASHFPLNLPLRLAGKIQKKTLDDPILRQFLPTKHETAKEAGFMKDPVGDEISRKKGRLLHKYCGRALLITTSACAMHCRYCFRQNFDYHQGSSDFSEEIEILSKDPSISEIILSGGDPLSLSDTVLQGLITRLERIPHLTRLRFHSRFPIGIPERINESFLDILSKTSLRVWFVIHCNHPLELDDSVLKSLLEIQKLGIPVLNQSVLLRGVNDDLQTLKALYEKLADHGIFAYYLHQLDKVDGAAHFEVSEEKGLSLINGLLGQLPGYAVPKYVREVAGQLSKTPLY